MSVTAKDQSTTFHVLWETPSGRTSSRVFVFGDNAYDYYTKYKSRRENMRIRVVVSGEVDPETIA